MTSDLEKNLALEEWLEYQLRLTRERIRELSAQDDRQLRARQRARAEQAWKIQPGRSAAVSLLHRGGCTLYSGSRGYLDRHEALALLAEPGVEPCGICRPETGLGPPGSSSPGGEPESCLGRSSAQSCALIWCHTHSFTCSQAVDWPAPPEPGRRR